MTQRCVWADGSIRPDGSRIKLKHCLKNRCNGVFSIVPPKFEDCFASVSESKVEKSRMATHEQGRSL